MSVRATARWLCVVVALSSPGLWVIGTVRPTFAGHGASTLVLDLEYVKLQFDKGRKFTAVDLRPVEHYRRGHLPGARSLPLTELATRFEEVPTVDLVVLYCDCSPSDAEDAYRFLRGRGYRNLSLMRDGFDAWVTRGYPIER
jgi:rhodanese-related sulfurtransferase